MILIWCKPKRKTKKYNSSTNFTCQNNYTNTIILTQNILVHVHKMISNYRITMQILTNLSICKKSTKSFYATAHTYYFCTLLTLVKHITPWLTQQLTVLRLHMQPLFTTQMDPPTAPPLSCCYHNVSQVVAAKGFVSWFGLAVRCKQKGLSSIPLRLSFQQGILLAVGSIIFTISILHPHNSTTLPIPLFVGHD